MLNGLASGPGRPKRKTAATRPGHAAAFEDTQQADGSSVVRGAAQLRNPRNPRGFERGASMLDAAASHAAKEHGQQLAIEFADHWKEQVLIELRGWCAIAKARGQTTFTFEQFRQDARTKPASPKAWGALAKIACTAGIIAPLTHPDGSPVYRLAESAKTHRHPVREWSLV